MCNARIIWGTNFRIFRRYTVEEAAAKIEELELDAETIYIEPPEGDLSDGDSGDEDGGGNFDNLSANQLRSVAQILLTNGEYFDLGECNCRCVM